MVSIEDAQRTILEYVTPLGSEKVPLFHGLNRITPQDHIAPWDIPPTDNSAMDGYAFSHAALVSNHLRVNGFLPTGGTRTIPVLPGETIKIMTGAPMPPDCDTVVPIEDVIVENDSIWLTSSIKAGSHVRKRGEDVQRGNVVITGGTLLRPQEIGLLSAMGTTAIAVYQKAKIAILATGNELLEPDSSPVTGKIINSNSYALAAQVLDSGGGAIALGNRS